MPFRYTATSLPRVGRNGQFSYVRFGPNVLDMGIPEISNSSLVIGPTNFGGAVAYFLEENDVQTIPCSGAMTYQIDFENIGFCRTTGIDSTTTTEEVTPTTTEVIIPTSSSEVVPTSSGAVSSTSTPTVIKAVPIHNFQMIPDFPTDLGCGFMSFSVADPKSRFNLPLLVGTDGVYMIDSGFRNCTRDGWTKDDSDKIEVTAEERKDELMEMLFPSVEKSQLQMFRPPRFVRVADTPVGRATLSVVMNAADRTVSIRVNGDEVYRICGHRNIWNYKCGVFPQQAFFTFGTFNRALEEMGDCQCFFTPAFSDIRVLCSDGEGQRWPMGRWDQK
jgi:hypothetical protein